MSINNYSLVNRKLRNLQKAREKFAKILDLYNKVEDSIERGVQMREEMEEQYGLSKSEK
jgi:uncharacterized protein YdcH (DUF465 family)